MRQRPLNSSDQVENSIQHNQPETNPAGFSWKSILRIALEHQRELIIANLLAILAVVASVPIPLLMPLLVDEVLLDKPGVLVSILSKFFPLDWLGPTLFIVATLIITVALRLLMLSLTVTQLQLFTNAAKDITFRMRTKLLNYIQTISMSEYETLGSGSVASHLITDVNAIDTFVGETISKTIVAALTLVGITGMLVWMHWQLALFILFMNPIVIYFTVVLGKRVKHLKLKENSAIAAFQQALTETLEAIHEIRASNREHYYFNTVVNYARGIMTHSAQFSWKSEAANRFSFGIFLLGFDVFRAITMLMVVYSDLSIGEMMAVFGYLWFMMAPVQEVLNLQYAFFAAKAALGRINRIFNMRLEPQYPHIYNPFENQTTVAIRVEDLCFQYGLGNDEDSKLADKTDDLILNNVNLEMSSGEKVALVGASGGGKSTFVQVLLGMYTPRSGQIYFNEVPITQIGLDVVRDNVATVLQHPAMFNDTVRKNLTMGKQFTDNQLYHALEIAQLSTVVKSMPQGLDTLVGHQGIRLSGGQRQRLAIARMVLTEPRVVILDEATSALDTETEANLHSALAQFLVGRTTIIIAHRLSAVKQADRAYVFDNGQIIEEGVHEDLLRSNALYNRLYGKKRQ